MLTLNNISYHNAGEYLFKDCSWHIHPKRKIGLIGLNGAGKSTLLKILNGNLNPSEGNKSVSKNLNIGFLHQDLLSEQMDIPIVDAAMQGFAKAIQVQKEIDAILEKIEINPTDDLLYKLGDLQEEFAALDGYDIKHKTEEVLLGLGFKNNELTKSFSQFSGGWRMRVILAKMLLQKPDLLLLDEPTNHLDLPSIEWLELYLKNYAGTYIIVSHDRWFLDKLVTEIVEIAHKKIYQYKGNYELFLKQKVERDELQQSRYDNQQIYIKEQERFIERFRSKASKATAVQSRVKALEKLDRIEPVERESASMNLRFKVANRPGKVIVELENVNKSYGKLDILKNSTASIYRGDKIALIGANGKGKSTLLRIIANTESFDGKRKLGHNVNTSFYAQHQVDSLTLKNEILEELVTMGSNLTETEIRSVLGCFLFTGEDVFKKIQVLSGGEKARVALAKTLVEESNFLLLDEPTNHLDMNSVSVLSNSLNQYEGTFVMVSHDRHFISKVANKFWWIDNFQLREYEGTYTEYLAFLEKQDLLTAPSEKMKVVKDNSYKNYKKNKGKSDQNNDHKILVLKKDMSLKEGEIKRLKENKNLLEIEMANPDNAKNYEKLNDLNEKHVELVQSLNNINKEYEKVFEQLLNLEH